MTINRHSVSLCPSVPNGTPDLKELALRVIRKHVEANGRPLFQTVPSFQCGTFGTPHNEEALYWLDVLEERAAIIEYDARMKRNIAEQWAYSEILVLWWEQNYSKNLCESWQGKVLTAFKAMGLNPPTGWCTIKKV